MASDMRLETSLCVPCEEVFRAGALPWLDEALEKVVMVLIDEWIAHAFGDVLLFGKLGGGLHGEDAFRDDGALVPVVQKAAQVVDLVFPEVSSRGKGTGEVSVKCAVADGRFCFIGVAGEDAAEGSGEGGKNPAAPVARLHVFFHEAREMDFAPARNRKTFQCFCRLIDELSDGDGEVGRAETRREVFGEPLRHF